jgi:hypothetical protein
MHGERKRARDTTSSWKVGERGAGKRDQKRVEARLMGVFFLLLFWL